MTQRSALIRYAIAMGAACVAILIRILLNPFLESHFVYSFGVAAVLLSAWFGGLGPGLFATAVSGLGLLDVTEPPLLSLRGSGSGDLVSLTSFLAIGALVSYLASNWRKTILRLRESERIYRTIGEAINYGAWICDPQGRNTYASESFLKLTGMTQDECSEFGWGRVLHPDDRERTIAAWTECVRTEGTWDIEHRFLGVDGKYHPILARGAPVKDERGRIIGWAGINLDLTRLRQAEEERAQLYQSLVRNSEELKRSNRELEQFAYAASHDLQEPLRTISIYTQLMMRDLPRPLPPRVDQHAEFIRSAVDRLQSLIRDLLTYSCAVHQPEAQPEARGSLRKALDQVLAALQPLIDECGATIESDSCLPEIVCDEPQLALLLQNVLSNALKYRKPEIPLRIQVRATVEDKFCTISVSDNGIGFSPEYAEHIFGLFKRLYRDEYPGTGLGLAICKRIVERYGGRIWADSLPNQGACFYFVLPLATGSESPSACS